MAFEKLSYSISSLKESIQAVKQSSKEYYKLSAYKGATKGVVSIIVGVLAAFFAIVALMFLSVALAIYLSNVLDSPSAGFFIVGGIYILFLILLFVVGKKYIEKTVLVKSSRKFFNN